MSEQSVRGTLRATISEVAANASVAEIRTVSVTIGVPPVPLMTYFGLGSVDYTVPTGSTVRLELQFSPEKSVPVMLVWDSPATSTRLVFEVEPIPRISLKITDTSGRASIVFPENRTGLTGLVAHVLVEDPFPGTNIQRVSLTIANSSGFLLLKDAPMNLTSRTELPFQLGYALPIAIPSGDFNITASVLDAVGGTVVTTTEIAVTSFYRLILMVVDLNRRPLAGLNVSVSAAGQLIDQVTTNSTGIATSRVPSSRAVGPFTLQILQKGVVILSRQIDLESDSVLQLEAPLSDWTLITRLQLLDIPIAAARVALYLNGTLVASGESDGNGVTHFTSLPLGAYEIDVTSYLASKRFLNVTHSADSNETALELPLISQITENALLIVAGVAVVAVAGAFAVTRRRKRTRRFKNVGELLGGTIPSAVVMILGPSGSGKSLLLQNILADSLQAGRHCVYASNSELPSRIKEQLKRIGVDAQQHEKRNTLRFIDAYSGATEGVSREKHFVPSPTDLTALGIQVTGCLEELGGVADVFFDSITPIVASGAFGRGLEFVRYYGARITKSDGTFIYVATPTIEPEALSRFEEASDCVLQMEKTRGPGKIRGRLLVKKARGLRHEHEWVGFKITSKGRMEFVSLQAEEA
jgi:KaiC/GvpD/RAD55 family RecA-like ATPase